MRKGVLGAAAAFALAATGPASAALVHAYDFDGGVIDLVGTVDGQLLGGASVAGGVLTLDGDGDYVQFASKLIPTAGADFSLFMSVKIDATQNGITEFISQGSSGAGFYVGTDGGSNFRLSDAYAGSGVALPSRGIFHDVLLVNGPNGSGGNDGFKFYIDGTLVFSGAKVTNYTSGGTDTRLGRQFDPFAEYFNGQIDNVRIFDTAVSYATASAPIAGGVPEPAAWAMMIVGFFAAGGLLRRGRTTAHAAA